MAAGVETTAAGTRERILEAALQAFSEEGFDGATTRDIAARAGVNLGLIKYYFDTKQKLWRTAVERAFSILREELAGSFDEGVFEDRERTRQALRRYVRFVGRHPEFVRLMHDEGKRRGPRMRWLVDHHVRPIFEGMTGQLGRAQKRGILPSGIDPLHFFYILVGAVGMIFHQAEECRRLTGVDPMDEAVMEAHADAVCFLLFGPEGGGS